jgi:hypothetical protein
VEHASEFLFGRVPNPPAFTAPSRLKRTLFRPALAIDASRHPFPLARPALRAETPPMNANDGDVPPAVEIQRRLS